MKKPPQARTEALDVGVDRFDFTKEPSPEDMMAAFNMGAARRRAGQPKSDTIIDMCNGHDLRSSERFARAWKLQRAFALGWSKAVDARPGEAVVVYERGVEDAGPRERYQHGDETLVEPTERAGESHVVILSRNSLDRYYRRQQLSPETKTKRLEDNEANRRLYDAGNQFLMEWESAGKEPQVICRYSDMVSSGAVAGFWGGRIDALAKWQRAVQAIGPIACNEVISVCCFGEDIGRERMILLRRGLDVLARHYGY